MGIQEHEDERKSWELAHKLLMEKFEMLCSGKAPGNDFASPEDSFMSSHASSDVGGGARKSSATTSLSGKDAKYDNFQKAVDEALLQIEKLSKDLVLKDDIMYETAGEETPDIPDPPTNVPEPPKVAPAPAAVNKPNATTQKKPAAPSQPVKTTATAKIMHKPTQPPQELELTPAEKVQAQTKGYYIEPSRLLAALPSNNGRHPTKQPVRPAAQQEKTTATTSIKR